MLVLLCVGIVFFFLVIGAAVFVLCSLARPLRRYALSSALWCAVWGPCTVAWLMLGGLVLVANRLAMAAAETRRFHLPSLPPKGSWIAYLAAYVICTALTATIVASAHQFIVHRMTLPLFRIYASLVSAGVGSVWGWCLWLWIMNNTDLPYRFLLCSLAMLALCSGFGYAGFRGAKQLRGEAPETFALVSREEFQGTA